MVDGVGAGPVLGSGDDLVELFGLGAPIELHCFLQAEHSRFVAINYLVGNALLLHQGRGVDDGFADVVNYKWIGP